MTIRGGGSPRDDRAAPAGRATMAHRLGRGDPRLGAAQSTGEAGSRSGTVSASDLARRGTRGRGAGSLRFIVLLLLAAAVVLALLATVGRPIVRGIVVDIAGDNPSALGIGFVADMVREDLGSAMTDPAGSNAADVPFVVAPGDTAGKIANRLVEAGELRG